MSLVKELKIVTVRHGLTEYNKKRVMSGWNDIDLSEVGILQLKQLKKEVTYPQTDRYVTSGLKRAKDTFEILFGDSQELHGSYEGFNEVNFGKIEAQPIDVVSEPFYEGFLNEKSYKEGETLDEFSKRNMDQLIQLCDELIEDNLNSVTIVSHSGTARFFDWIFNEKKREQYRSPSMPNGLGHIFIVDYNPVTKTFKLKQQLPVSASHQS